jgi:hypothetical protein
MTFWGTPFLGVPLLSAVGPSVLALGAAPNPFLNEAKELYQAAEFEKCVVRLTQASKQWQSTKEELRDIEVYAGLCQFNLGRRRAAAQHFRTSLRIDENSELPPYSSPKAVDLFLKVKQALRAPPEPFPDEDLPPDDAPREVKLEPQRSGPSFFEKHPTSVTLVATSALSIAIAIGLGINARNLSVEANEASSDAAFGEKALAARSNALGANVAYIIAGSALVAAVIAFFVE